MARRRHDKRWDHPVYRYAFVREHRGMACTVIHGSDPVSTGYRWTPASKAHAMRVLEERLRQHQQGPTMVPTKAGTCHSLLVMYAQARFAALTSRRARYVVKCFNALVPPNLVLTDHHAIRDAIAVRLAALEYAQNTKRTMMKAVRSVFQFGVAEGLLRANPVHTSMVPPEPVVTPDPYTDEDVFMIIGNVPSGRPRLFVRFLAATGCRAGEAITLRWDMVHGDHVVIDGKRSRRDVPAMRILPYPLMPDLKPVLEDARGLKHPDTVFGLASYYQMQQHVRDACSRTGTEYRGLHAIRAWRIDRWAKVDRYPEEVITALAGHTEQVSRKHYRTPHTAAELVGLASDSRARLDASGRLEPA